LNTFFAEAASKIAKIGVDVARDQMTGKAVFSTSLRI
jgi:hypothetical protein